VRKLFIGTTFAAMENHRTDSIPNDSYPVKSDRLLGKEVRGLGIHVTAAEPGSFRTDWAGRSMVRGSRSIADRHGVSASIQGGTASKAGAQTGLEPVTPSLRIRGSVIS
jgi:hypothetical protein